MVDGNSPYGHGMPCPYMHIISYCIHIGLKLGWGGMTPPLRGTISHATLCGLGRNGHGMPCPYTRIISYCIHIVGGRDNPAPTGRHITWHALRIATEWARHAHHILLHTYWIETGMGRDNPAPTGHHITWHALRFGTVRARHAVPLHPSPPLHPSHILLHAWQMEIHRTDMA